MRKLKPKKSRFSMTSHLCAETIYRFIYSKEEYALKLYEYLAEMRTKRCPRGTRRSRSSRISRYCVIIKNNSQHSKPIMNKIIQAFAALPYHARRSFTFDRGFEFMAYRALEDGMGARSWFCDPNSPWQEGAIDNINKRIRRYLPSNTDLRPVAGQPGAVDCPRPQSQCNARKCLGLTTPTKDFACLLQDAA